MADLLLELFSEEIPARMQEAAAALLKERMLSALEGAGLAAEITSQEVRTFVTPRRLAVRFAGIPVSQPDVTTERKGPRVDAPAAAIEGFLRSTGLTLPQLENRGGVYFAAVHQKGRPTAEVLQEMIEKILAEFTWPKSMRWGMHDIRWVRPLHSILCLFGGKAVPVRFGPITAGNVTYGHRFLAPQAIAVHDANEYETSLANAFVIADAQRRKEEIRAKADAAARALDLSVKPDEGLLAEVTGLVEWPVVLAGRIDAQFMDLPPEVLVSEMRAHQKYFALQTAEGALADRFLIVSNMETKDAGNAVTAGNERVLRARLSDGRFFWDQDRKKTLDEWAEGLKTVTYHAKLGSVAEKVERVAALALLVAESVKDADSALVERAARLCKADLVTGMVGEFPELQGIMGGYYARHQKEAPAVANAIRDHYKPQGPNDSVPTAPVSACVALADKLDSIVGMFSIGEKPTGSKDPFALRRAALGIIRIILENGIHAPLRGLVGYSGMERVAEPQQENILSFFLDRLKVMLREEGIRHDVIDAAYCAKHRNFAARDLCFLAAYIKALQAMLHLNAGARLVLLAKRVLNILSIEEKKDGRRFDAGLNAALFGTEEQALHAAIQRAASEVQTGLDNENFALAMDGLLAVQEPLETFFDKILVNDGDTALRANRLNLLGALRAVLDQCADFALIEG